MKITDLNHYQRSLLYYFLQNFIMNLISTAKNAMNELLTEEHKDDLPGIREYNDVFFDLLLDYIKVENKLLEWLNEFNENPPELDHKECSTLLSMIDIIEEAAKEKTAAEIIPEYDGPDLLKDIYDIRGIVQAQLNVENKAL